MSKKMMINKGYYGSKLAITKKQQIKRYIILKPNKQILVKLQKANDL